MQGTVAFFTRSAALLALLPLLLSASPAQDLRARIFVQDPVLFPNPNPAVPLAAVIRLQTGEPTTVELALKDGERSWTVLAEPELLTVHHVKVLGVRPSRTHHISVTVRDAQGNATTWPHELAWTTPGLPPLFPPLQTTVSQPDLMEPGVTFFNATNDGDHPSYLIIVDQAGEVIWFYETDHNSSDARRLRNDNFLYIHDRFLAVEVDVLGNVQNQWFAAGLGSDNAPPGAILVPTDTFHHEISEMPASELADFVTISTELRTYPTYPADEIDQTQTNPTAEVIGDVIVEFTRAGGIVRETSLLDILDPYRVCYDSLGNFWNLTYSLPNTEDWTHGNAVVFAPDDDAYIVSARSQESILKIRRDTGELVWILGPHGNWGPPWNQYLLTPVGASFEWNYHQHAPEIQANGDILLFDNGNGRAIPPDPVLPFDQRYSRAVQYRVDSVAMTVEQVWAYGGPAPAEQFYSRTRGDADRMLLTGNVLVADSDRRPTATSTLSHARVVEVTSADPPLVVFELYVRDLSPTEPRAWNVYRSEHFTSVYPHL